MRARRHALPLLRRGGQSHRRRERVAFAYPRRAVMNIISKHTREPAQRKLVVRLGLAARSATNFCCAGELVLKNVQPENYTCPSQVHTEQAARYGYV